MKNLVAISMVLVSSIAWSQQAPPTNPAVAPKPIPAAKQVTAADATPPIPVVRELVNGMVEEQRAVMLTPEQIEKLKSGSSEARQAASFQYPKQFVAKPVARSMQWKPGALQQPRMIRLSSGTITTLVFSDEYGNPWLVSSASWDKALFTDGSDGAQGGQPKQASNIVNIWPTQQYAYGNIVLQLEGLSTPINFMLSTGQSDQTDVSVDIRVSGKNPNAAPTGVTTDHLPEHDSVLGYFLDGLPPQGSKALQVSGAPGEAWSYHGALYVRTTVSLLSPAFIGHGGNAEGMHVYKLFSLVPSLLVSDAGRTQSMQISGY